jgi:hypothetical protein
VIHIRGRLERANELGERVECRGNFLMALSRTVMLSSMTLTLIVGMAAMAPTKSNFEPSVSITYGTRSILPAGKTHRVLISGHSLIDKPFPDYLADIAASAGISLRWDMQKLTGSSIRQRLVDKEAIFAKASRGEEHRLGLMTERALPSASGGGGYDIMIITEQHRVLDSLIWEDTIQSLRNFHDRFLASNAGGQTYFFAPWISLSDRANPQEWIIFESKALPVWQCIVMQVNKDLAAQGRADRIEFIPTSWALARLIENLTSGADVAGFQGLDTRAKVGAIFSDDVHLSKLGAYYVAAISFSTLYPNNQSLVRSQSLDAAQAASVLGFASAFMEEYRRSLVPSEKVCSSVVSFAFGSHYAAYTEKTYHRREKGILAARFKRLRDTLRYAWRFSDGLR